MMKVSANGALLVEDEVFVVLDVEDALRGHGIEIAAVYASNKEALEWLKNNRPSVAVIDFRLKDGNSVPVAKALHSMGIPTVVYSGNAFEADLHREDFGDFPWVEKPGDPEDLLAAVKIAMRHSA
tara:strand:+ start:115 stop:489 length:375 start_codon:yes stop_codon:yes gene_type:complete